MNVQTIRPPIADLVFHLYDRSLHPELYEALAERKIERDGYDLHVTITRTGHVLTWHTKQLTLTELTTCHNADFPTRKRLFSHRLRGEYNTRVIEQKGFRYQMSFQVETLPQDVFLHVHDEILADGGKRGLLHNFQPHHRLALAPLGFVTAEANCRSLILTTFHTFPDEQAIVKTQSLIERG